MDKHIVQRAKALSEEAIREAGQISWEKFGKGTAVKDKGDFGDVVTEVDYLAEEIIIKRIQSDFPGHQIHSEEAGSLGGAGDWLWMIDPLDGTNNFAAGLPVFTASITLLFKREPVLGVVYEPVTDRMFTSVLGSGAFCNNRMMQVKQRTSISKGNIGWIQGHNVRNEPKAVRLRQHIDVNVKRMMRLWAPTLQWCMLANGDIEGIVLYNSEGDDLYSGVLMVKEAGGVVVDFEGRPFTGMKEEPYLVACHPNDKEELLRLVRDGLAVR